MSDDLIRKEDFMCVCSDESKATTEACTKRVMEDLGDDRGNLVSAVVMALNWGLEGPYYGQIDFMGCDQWFGVSAVVWTYEDNERKDVGTIWMPCDFVEDGVARIWELAQEIVKEHSERP